MLAQTLMMAATFGISYAQNVLQDSPVAYWPLNETSGAVANDLSGNGYSAAYQATPTLGAAPIAPGLGTSVALNGTSQYVSIGSVSGSLDTYTGSFEAWFNLPAASNESGWPAIISSDGSGANPIAVSAAIQTNGTVDAGYYSGSAWYQAKSSTAVNTGASFHLVYVNTGTELLLYLNGVLVSSLATTEAAVTVADWYLGFNPSQTSYLNGRISNCAIYNTALSAARILAHYNAGIA
jgi:hypothetical protein